MVSIQSSHTSPSKCKCSSPSGNLMSCFFLTPWFCSLNYLSCGDVIYGTSYLCSFHWLSCGSVIYGTSYLCSFHWLSCGSVIYGTSYLCSFHWLSYGNVIYGTVVVYLNACTIGGIALIIVGTTNGSTLPFIIFYALKFVFSCSLFILNSTLFFFLRTLFRKSTAAFFLFSSVICISSLVLLTLADGFCGLSF